MSFKFSRTGMDNHQQEHYLDYRAGQYCIMDLGTKEDPEGPVRSFTMASSPTEKDFILVSTRIRDTPFKKKLDTLEIGSDVSITAPLGRFVLQQTDDSVQKPAVFLSGGIGVTPFRSMIKYATDSKLPLKITMFDANRDVDNIVFKDEFDSWLGSNPNLRIVYTINNTSTSAGDWKGETGYVTEAMVKKHLDSAEINDAIFYVCGPPAMLGAMKKLLIDNLSIPEEKIMIEEFIGY